MTKYVLTDPMGSIPKFMVTVAHKQITQSAAMLASFLQKKFGEKDRSLSLPVTLSEPNKAIQKDSFESDDDSFCSLESYDDDEFSVVDASQEFHRINPQTRSRSPSNAHLNGPLKHTNHIQEQSNLQLQNQHQHHKQQQKQQPQPQPQPQQQNYQWKCQNSSTNNKTSPHNEKVEKKTGTLDSGISDATITKTLIEIQKNVAKLQLQIDRIERVQSRNSILTHLFYFSWPVVVVVAYHIFRKKIYSA